MENPPTVDRGTLDAAVDEFNRLIEAQMEIARKADRRMVWEYLSDLRRDVAATDWEEVIGRAH